MKFRMPSYRQLMTMYVIVSLQLTYKQLKEIARDNDQGEFGMIDTLRFYGFHGAADKLESFEERFTDVIIGDLADIPDTNELIEDIASGFEPSHPDVAEALRRDLRQAASKTSNWSEDE